LKLKTRKNIFTLYPRKPEYHAIIVNFFFVHDLNKVNKHACKRIAPKKSSHSSSLSIKIQIGSHELSGPLVESHWYLALNAVAPANMEACSVCAAVPLHEEMS